MENIPLNKIHLHTPYLKDGEIYFTCGAESHLLEGEKETIKNLFIEEIKKQADNKPNTV